MEELRGVGSAASKPTKRGDPWMDFSEVSIIKNKKEK